MARNASVKIYLFEKVRDQERESGKKEEMGDGGEIEQGRERCLSSSESLAKLLQ